MHQDSNRQSSYIKESDEFNTTPDSSHRFKSHRIANQQLGQIKITDEEDDYYLPPFIITIKLNIVQIVGLGRLFLSVTRSGEHHPGRNCDTGSESRLEQHPSLDMPTDPQFPLVGKTETWVAADSGEAHRRVRRQTRQLYLHC